VVEDAQCVRGKGYLTALRIGGGKELVDCGFDAQVALPSEYPISWRNRVLASHGPIRGLGSENTKLNRVNKHINIPL
jgi:hypothetical protein